MKCHIIELPKPKLATLPTKEIAFLTVILHLANEINILHKAAIASKPGGKLPDPIVDSAHNCQALFFLKILAGKLYDGWRTIETGFFATKISRKYERLLPQLSKDALERLKKYFADSSNVVKDVRQKYAFHTDFERITESLNSLPDSEPLRIAITDSIGNIYAQFAEAVTNWSVLNAIETKTMDEAIKKLMTEALLTVPNDFLHFAYGFGETALGQCDYTATEHQLDGATSIDAANLPYFVDQE